MLKDLMLIVLHDERRGSEEKVRTSFLAVIANSTHEPRAHERLPVVQCPVKTDERCDTGRSSGLLRPIGGRS